MTFKELLKEKDCTMARISRQLSVSGEAVRGWAEGKHIPTLDKAVMIAKVLGVDLETVAKSILGDVA